MTHLPGIADRIKNTRGTQDAAAFGFYIFLYRHESIDVEAALRSAIGRIELVPVDPAPTYIESSGRWKWPLPERARFQGCCTEVVTASREWWEYAPSEAKPHPSAEAVRLRDDKWYWAVTSHERQINEAPQGDSAGESRSTLERAQGGQLPGNESGGKGKCGDSSVSRSAEYEPARVSPNEEICTYCGESYPKPISYHHSTEECHENEARNKATPPNERQINAASQERSAEAPSPVEGEDGAVTQSAEAHTSRVPSRGVEASCEAAPLPSARATGESIADMIPLWYEGGTVEQMLDEAFAQIRILEASAPSTARENNAAPQAEKPSESTGPLSRGPADAAPTSPSSIATQPFSPFGENGQAGELAALRSDILKAVANHSADLSSPSSIADTINTGETPRTEQAERLRTFASMLGFSSQQRELLNESADAIDQLERELAALHADIEELNSQLASASAAAVRWYKAASPYSTPEALKEALATSADWHKIADERSAEIIRLERELAEETKNK